MPSVWSPSSEFVEERSPATVVGDRNGTVTRNMSDYGPFVYARETARLIDDHSARRDERPISLPSAEGVLTLRRMRLVVAAAERFRRDYHGTRFHSLEPEVVLAVHLAHLELVDQRQSRRL